MEIPMNVEVICTNGVYGRSTCVILDLKDKKVTHVVVREKMKPHTERIVPIRLVTETSPTAIQLDCTTERARKMETFIAVEHIHEDTPKYRDTNLILWPFDQAGPFYPSRGQYIKVHYERIPPGELALQKGARVKVKDGFIGHVQEFLINPKDGRITHLILHEGHLWGRKDREQTSAVLQPIDSCLGNRV